jgi:hypothetical protein
MSQTTPPADPVSAFWRDLWNRMSPIAQQGQSGDATGTASTAWGFPGISPFAAMGGGAPGFANPMMAGAAGFPTPDMVKRMQAAFFESMAQYAEQYMRSPQFLESMKRSMDGALTLRQQMDDFLKSSMASALNAPGGGGAPVMETVAAVREAQNAILARLDELSRRLDAMEHGGKAEGTSKPAPAKKETARGR